MVLKILQSSRVRRNQREESKVCCILPDNKESPSPIYVCIVLTFDILYW